MPDPDTPHTTDLVAYWPLDEAASATREDRVGSNDLTTNGTVGQGMGLCSYAAMFNGMVANYLSIADNAALSRGNFDYTGTAWVNFATNTGTRVIMCKGSSAGAQGQEFQLYHSGTFRIEIGNGAGSSVSVNSGVAAVNGEWYFLRWWHDSVNDIVGIAVNEDTPVTSAYSAGSYDSTHEMTIGRYSNFAGGAVNGVIERVGLWNRVLSTNDGLSLYNSGMCFNPLATMHPVGMLTHQGPWAVPSQRYGMFMGKPEASVGGTHPVGLLTTLGPWGVPQERYSTFAGKPESSLVAVSRFKPFWRPRRGR